jgi:TonB-linked SusC/RagA family outer membrane protein
MKISAFLLFCCIENIFASPTYSQDTKISLDLKDATIEEVLNKIEDVSEFYFLYNNKLIDVTRKVNIEADNEPIKDILKDILDKGTAFIVYDRQIILIPSDLTSTTLLMQQQKLTGKVTDEKGNSMPGVTILIKGTSQGALTDAAGQYIINNVPKNATLIFSFVGMTTQEIDVSGRASVDVVLKESAISLDDVVVIGYGAAKRSDITGSVSTVSNTVINRPSTNILQSIQGNVAGVIITQGSSIPGDSPDIYIKGLNSISASNYPLIIVDNVPGSLDLINPNDIASISILKDASSCAIYGSRGSNGVIIVTTKRGKEKPTISYNGYVGISQATNLIDFMGPEKYLYYREKNAEYGGLPYEPADVLHSKEEMLNYNSGRTTNWQDLIFKNAIETQHNLSISGGEKSLNYFVSVSYQDNDYIAGNYNLKRISIRSNIDKEFKNWLKIGNNLFINQSKHSGSTGDLWSAAQLNPWSSPTDPNGNVYIWPLESYTKYLVNPLTTANNIINGNTVEINDNVFANLQLPIKGLEYKISYGVTIDRNVSNSYSGRNTADGLLRNGVASKGSTDGFYWILENIVNYKRTFNKHTFSFTGLYSAEESKDETMSATAFNFLNDIITYNNLGAASSYSPPSSSGSQSALTSFMGRLNYDFSDKYLITFTLRRDGYSAFGKNNKFGNFPSAAFAWRISQEDYMKSFEFISQLKLRLSYGKNGNQSIPSYSSLAKIVSSVPYPFGNSADVTYGFLPGNIANSNLGWESTLSSNIGLDFGLFNNRITGTVEYYHTKTSDLLLTRGIPYTTGFSSIYGNIGKTQNDGVEFTLNTINITRKGGFNWTSSLNLSYNKNKIVDLYGDKKDDIGNNWFIGKPIKVYYDYVFDGIWQESDDITNSVMPKAKPGDTRVKDIRGPDGGPDGKIDAYDRQIVGNMNPDFTWGFVNTFEYKGFDLSFSLQGVIGVTGYTNISNNAFGDQYMAMLNVNYWLPESPSNKYPTGILGHDYTYASASYYYNKDYLRLKYITLGYTFSPIFLKKIGADKLRLYMNATNLLTITAWPLYDPETNLSNGAADTPMSKSYDFGISVNF